LVHLPSLATGDNDWEPALSPDGRYLVFMRQLVNSFELYMATRVGPTEFTPPRVLTELNTSAVESGATWAPTGDRLYFSSTSSSEARLYVSDFVDGTFQAPVLVSELGSVNSPTIRGDGLEMYFDDASLPGDFKVSRAIRAAQGDPWSTTGLETQLATGFALGYPSISHDGLRLYFEGTNAAGNGKIYMATRAAVTDRFGTPSLVTDFGEAAGIDLGDPEISADDQLMLMSARGLPDTTGGFDIYASTRSCL
jgi:Tol biopolymer transport system component